MDDRHRLYSCEGDLYDIKDKLTKLFIDYPYGGWGRLMLMADYKNDPDNTSAQIVTTLQFDILYFDDL